EDLRQLGKLPYYQKTLSRQTLTVKTNLSPRVGFPLTGKPFSGPTPSEVDSGDQGRVQPGEVTGQPRPHVPADVVGEHLEAALLDAVEGEPRHDRRVVLRAVDVLGHVGV